MITAKEVRERQKPIIEEYEIEGAKKLEQVVRDILPIIEEEILKETKFQSIAIQTPYREFAYVIGSKRIEYEDLILQGFGMHTIIEAITPHLEDNGYIISTGRTAFYDPFWTISWHENKQQEGDNNEQTT